MLSSESSVATFQMLYRFHKVLKKHSDAPLFNERRVFLVHLHRQGASRTTIQNAGSYLLRAVKALNISEMRVVDEGEIQAAVIQLWGDHSSKDQNWEGSRAAYAFRAVIRSWLRFHGCLKKVKGTRQPYSQKIRDYRAYQLARRLAFSTIESNSSKALVFLKWLSTKNISLSKLQLAHVDRFISMKRLDGWALTSIRSCIYGARDFLRYAETRRWCKSGLWLGVHPPNGSRHPARPQGRDWKEVKKLLRSIHGKTHADLRAKAALLIIATYGFRISEMARLKVSDFDFSNRTLSLRRSKNHELQRYPLDFAVALAVQQYLEVRPRQFDRIFLTVKTPYRPVNKKSFYAMSNYRLEKIGITTGRRGPHAIRHARATELLRVGTPLNDIRDFLGHRSHESPLVYAKFTVESLRKVSDFSLGKLL